MMYRPRRVLPCSALIAMLLVVVVASGAYGRVKKKAVRDTNAAPSIPVYDAYRIVDVNRSEGEKPIITVNALEPVGAKKDVSVLASVAKSETCMSAWADEIDEKIQTGYVPDNAEEAEFWGRMKSFGGLQPLACAVVTGKGGSVLVLTAAINATPRDQWGTPDKVLWIAKLDAESRRPGEVLYAGMSIRSIYDTKRDLGIEAIADMNGDRLHDIILHDIRYAGDSFIILASREDGGIEIKKVRGSSWD